MELRICHTWDGQPCLPEEEVQLHLSVAPSLISIRIRAPYHGDPPPPSQPGPTDFLWEYEVVELFFLGSNERYTEIELSPHGHYLVLQLAGRRHAVRRCLPIEYQATIQGFSWEGRASIPRSLLPEDSNLFNATAIHGQGSQRRYLSWTPLPGPHPDFHRLEEFAPLELPRALDQ
jgi:hypothetical protein